MKVWQSEVIRPHGVWTSEVRLRTASLIRKGKVNKLLNRISVREKVSEVKDALVL